MTVDPITRWEALLAAEVDHLRAIGDTGPTESEGVTFTPEGALLRRAVAELARRDSELHEAYLAEFNLRHPPRPSRSSR